MTQEQIVQQLQKNLVKAGVTEVIEQQEQERRANEKHSIDWRSQLMPIEVLEDLLVL